MVTDHHPLKWLNTMTAPNNLFAHWISEIQSYGLDVIHHPGKLHGNADYMSRYPVQDDLMAVIDLRDAQLEDAYCGAWIKYLEDGIVPADKRMASRMEKEKDRYFMDEGNLYQKCVTKTGRTREQFVAPKTLVGQLLVKFHDHPLSGHARFFRMYRKLQLNYFWPSMKSDIKRHIRHCSECAKFKSTKPSGKTPLKPITTN